MTAIEIVASSAIDAFDGPRGHAGVEHASADQPGHQATEHTEADLAGRELGRVAGPAGFLGDGEGEENGDHGHGDAVVEPTLDVERLPDPHRQPAVAHHGLAQGRIGRGENRGEQRRLGQTDAGQHSETPQRSGHDGERHPDAEQAAGQRRVMAEGPQVDPDGVGEQHQHQGGLDQQRDGLAPERLVEPAEPRCADEHPHRREHHRSGDRRHAQSSGDQREPEDRHPNDQNLDHKAILSVSVRAWVAHVRSASSISQSRDRGHVTSP